MCPLDCSMAHVVGTLFQGNWGMYQQRRDLHVSSASQVKIRIEKRQAVYFCHLQRVFTIWHKPSMTGLQILLKKKFHELSELNHQISRLFWVCLFLFNVSFPKCVSKVLTYLEVVKMKGAAQMWGGARRNCLSASVNRLLVSRGRTLLDSTSSTASSDAGFVQCGREKRQFRRWDWIELCPFHSESYVETLTPNV